VYPRQRLTPSIVRVLSDLGIRLQDQTQIRLDIEPLPDKIDRSFCAPIAVPNITARSTNISENPGTFCSKEAEGWSPPSYACLTEGHFRTPFFIWVATK